MSARDKSSLVDPPVNPQPPRRRTGRFLLGGVVLLLGLGTFGFVHVNITVNPPAPAAAAGPAQTGPLALGAQDRSTLNRTEQLERELKVRQAAPMRTAQVEPEEQEPEKTLPELLAAADKDIAAKKWDDAASDLEAALNKTSGQTLQVADINLKLGQVHLADNSQDDGKSNLQQALSIYERIYGPFDAQVLPALRGLIAAHDGAGEYDDSARLLDRYARVAGAVGAEKVAVSDSEEAAARSFIAAAEKRVQDAQKEAKANDQEDTSCLCAEIAQSIKDATDQYGARSYVVALLTMKQAEINDSSDSVPEDNQVGEPELRQVLSMFELRFSPTDSHLAPVLKRLIASYDADGKHEDADRMIARFGLLKDAPRANPTPAMTNQKRH